jgi:hypothetical protein
VPNAGAEENVACFTSREQSIRYGWCIGDALGKLRPQKRVDLCAKNSHLAPTRRENVAGWTDVRDINLTKGERKMARKSWNVVGWSLVAVAWLAIPAYAQRGTGESTGVARQATLPELTEVAGTIQEVRDAPCESTTGGATRGTHLLLATEDGRVLNVHLGPSASVGFAVNQLNTGQSIVASVFRTEKLADENFVAKSLTVDSRKITLRDDTLRPVWAGGRRGDVSVAQGRRGRRGGGRPAWAGFGPGNGPCGIGTGTDTVPADVSNDQSDNPTDVSANDQGGRAANLRADERGRGPRWGNGGARGRGRGYGNGAGNGRGRGYGNGGGNGWGRGYGNGGGNGWGRGQGYGASQGGRW